MNTYTLDQLTTLVNALMSRVNALDGQNLPYPTTGSIPNLVTQLNSLKTDLGQIAASFESQLSTMNAKIAVIQGLINTLSGQPNTQGSQGQ